MTLGDFAGAAAVLGGWCGGADWGRPNGPRAGYESFWKGYMRLQERVSWERWRRKRERHRLHADNGDAAA